MPKLKWIHVAQSRICHLFLHVAIHSSVYNVHHGVTRDLSCPPVDWNRASCSIEKVRQDAFLTMAKRNQQEVQQRIWNFNVQNDWTQALQQVSGRRIYRSQLRGDSVPTCEQFIAIVLHLGIYRAVISQMGGQGEFQENIAASLPFPYAQRFPGTLIRLELFKKHSNRMWDWGICNTQSLNGCKRGWTGGS